MDFWQEEMRNINEYHRKLETEFLRLRDNIPPVLKVGDRVVVATGLLSRGHLWVRKICTVLEIGNNSCCVRCDEDYGEPWTEWIDLTLIIDVLPRGEIVKLKPQKQEK